MVRHFALISLAVIDRRTLGYSRAAAVNNNQLRIDHAANMHSRIIPRGVKPMVRYRHVAACLAWTRANIL